LCSRCKIKIEPIEQKEIKTGFCLSVEGYCKWVILFLLVVLIIVEINSNVLIKHIEDKLELAGFEEQHESNIQNETTLDFQSELGENRTIDPIGERPKTYFAIFSGRQRYLEILFQYITKFLDEGLIDEVHLWDFSRKTEDAEYIAGVAQSDPRFVIKGNGKMLRDIARNELPKKVQARKKECLAGKVPDSSRIAYYCNLELFELHELWKTMTHKMFPLFYSYYAHYMNKEDILIKCDDDVLYINNLLPFIEFARRNPQVTMTYPSIVNNELAAHFQLRENMIPDPKKSLLYKNKWKFANELVEIFTTLSLPGFYDEHESTDYGSKLRTQWYATYSAAWFLHDTFIKDPERFRSEAVYFFQAPTRVSINMFAMRGDACKKYFSLEELKEDKLSDDEETISWLVQKTFRTTSAFFLNTTCAHYSFSRQLLDLDNANKTFLWDYAVLAAKLGHPTLYQPKNALLNNLHESFSNPSAKLVIGKSMQVEALKALRDLNSGAVSDLVKNAKKARNQLKKKTNKKEGKSNTNSKGKRKIAPGRQ